VFTKLLKRKLGTLKTKLMAFVYMGEMTKRIHDGVLHDLLDKLKRSPRYQDPKSLIPFGYSLYSQNEEDGMIREIFNRIGTANKTFIEFGVGDGLQNNTLALLFEGWKGLWIEANDISSQQITENFRGTIERGNLKFIKSFVTKENIDALISSAGFPEDVDLLSVDIDGNDFHILKAISCVKPRVLALEYNAKFPPPILYCMNYNGQHEWIHDDCWGASLKFFEVELSKMGYCLVGCCLSGVNAFFVKKELVGEKFLSPFTAEHHYEPQRGYFATLPSGHKPSYQALEKMLPSLRQ